MISKLVINIIYVLEFKSKLKSRLYFLYFYKCKLPYHQHVYPYCWCKLDHCNMSAIFMSNGVQWPALPRNYKQYFSQTTFWQQSKFFSYITTMLSPSYLTHSPQLLTKISLKRKFWKPFTKSQQKWPTATISVTIFSWPLKPRSGITTIIASSLHSAAFVLLKAT